MKQLYTLLCSFILLFFFTRSFAAEGEKIDVPTKTIVNSPIGANAFIETLLGLGLILAIIVALAWLIRRTGRFQTSVNGEIKIIAGLSLGPRERAVLLQVGQEQILVGVTAQNIQTLHILGQAVDTQKDNNSGKAEQFNSHLKNILGQNKP